MSPMHHPSDPPASRGRPGPTLAEFEALAAAAYARLPADFRGLCEDLVIRVDDFPTAEVLAHGPRSRSTCWACSRASGCRSGPR